MPEEEGMITFELIRRIQREEQTSLKLSKLPKGFHGNVNSYLDSKKNVNNRKTVLEVKNIERLAEDIFNRRERKILNMAIISARTNIPPENLTDEERLFFDQILAVVKARRKEMLADVVAEEEDGEKAELISFNQDIPEFVGADMKKYGPFKKGDIARLPEENRDILVNQNVAKEFKISK